MVPCRQPSIVLLMLALPASADPNTAVGLRVPPGFTVTEFAGDELAHDCYTLTINPKGQVVVAGRGYIRTLIDDDGDGKADRAIEVADNPKDGAMGLLWEGDTLWAVGDGGLRRFKIGPDGKAVDPSELVYKLKTGGEHDAHALRRGPDGWLYWLCGNDAGVGAKEAGPESMVYEPVAGAVLRFSPDMSRRDVFADGFRNAYDFDFTSEGKLFTFDSDNERCVGLPWYEGCRLYHVVPGGHYGWRAPQRGTFWRMPPHFRDVIAPVADLGRGSPTGVACYRHRQFPEKYRGGLFLGDWTFGRIYYAELTRSGDPITTAAEGATIQHTPDKYSAKVETFLESVGDNGFAPTGLAVHPTTGDLYVSIGGRGTRGAVYRVRYESGLKDAAGFTTPPLPHKDPPLPLAERHGSRAHMPTEMPARSSEMHRQSLLYTIRQWERKAGDIGAKAEMGTVFEGYTVPSPEVIPAWFVANMGFSFRRNLPPGADNLEQARLFAIVADGDPERFRSVVARLTPTSDPLDDTHYLIVLARMTAPRTPDITAAIADALLGLDRKLADRRIARDTNWPLRMAELHAELARKDPQLNAALVAHAELTRPNNVVFTRCPGFDRRRAAERFLGHARQGGGFPWSPELVLLMGELPAETARPLLLTLWDRGGFEDAILPLLARDPQPADHDKFLAGLRSPQRIARCLDALDKLPTAADATELLPLVRALRSLGESKGELTVRDHVGRRLQKLTGQTIGPDKTGWSNWLTRAHPDLAAKLGGPDGVDVVAWQKRLAAVDWTTGDPIRGKATYAKASCAGCHSGGSAVGPDLRGVGGRFGRDDLLTAIIQPSKDIAARYRTVQIATTDGKTYQGLIVYEAVDGLILQTGPATSVRIGGAQIESRGFSDTSLMPAGLMDKLADAEIADLLAYLKALK
jgi:putative heme-binding domain-containing protein